MHDRRVARRDGLEQPVEAIQGQVLETGGLEAATGGGYVGRRDGDTPRKRAQVVADAREPQSILLRIGIGDHDRRPDRHGHRPENRIHESDRGIEPCQRGPRREQ